MWVSYGFDEDVDEPSEGLGPDKDQFPMDRNVTFFFDYTQGTSFNTWFIKCRHKTLTLYTISNLFLIFYVFQVQLKI